MRPYAPRCFQLSSRLRFASPPSAVVARGYASLMNVTLWPMKTLSSMCTPSQMKVWLEILQRRPTRGILLNFDKRADFGFVADFASIHVDELGKLDVLSRA